MNYIGRRHDAKHFVVSDGRATSVDNANKTPFTSVEGVNDAYISVADYWKIQERMFSGKPSVRGDSVYVFSGMVRCGHCGRLMSGGKNKNDKHQYQCRNAREKVNTEWRSWIAYEDEMLRYIVSRLTDELEGKVLEALSVNTPTLDVDTSELEKKLTSLEAKIARMNRRIADEENELLIDGYKSTLLELLAEKKEVQHQLEQKRSTANLDDWKASLSQFWQDTRTVLVKTGEVTIRNHWIGKQTVDCQAAIEPARLRETLKQLGTTISVWFEKGTGRKKWQVAKGIVTGKLHGSLPCGVQHPC